MFSDRAIRNLLRRPRPLRRTQAKLAKAVGGPRRHPRGLIRRAKCSSRAFPPVADDRVGRGNAGVYARGLAAPERRRSPTLFGSRSITAAPGVRTGRFAPSRRQRHDVGGQRDVVVATHHGHDGVPGASRRLARKSPRRPAAVSRYPERARAHRGAGAVAPGGRMFDLGDPLGAPATRLWCRPRRQASRRCQVISETCCVRRGIRPRRAMRSRLGTAALAANGWAALPTPSSSFMPMAMPAVRAGARSRRSKDAFAGGWASRTKKEHHAVHRARTSPSPSLLSMTFLRAHRVSR